MLFALSNAGMARRHLPVAQMSATAKKGLRDEALDHGLMAAAAQIQALQPGRNSYLAAFTS
ncbi:hypothetical protein [Variovorax sp. efr-133-TYG-130]|uniref:hypothetical protein n=1 Tax=Variovorax sp. efr-133-TYG-130 TaxID=3040327 RepID=UPI002555C60E|nr:hypothetical protein [Variovorax sp. efr-133-TYG-130]